MTLTADGWALMPYIQEICRQQRSIEERAKDLQGLETGVVRVAVFTSVSVQWMPYILKSFREQYPNIEFELLPSNYNTEIARWIQDGTADCGFLVLPTEANLDCWLLQRDQWKAIVPWDHPLAGREPFPPEALAQYPFILLEEGDDYEIQEVLDTLAPREKKVLELRFGIVDGRTRTLEEVGKEFNVTRERIRQIEAKALRKLRHPSRSKKLRDFLS